GNRTAERRAVGQRDRPTILKTNGHVTVYISAHVLARTVLECFVRGTLCILNGPYRGGTCCSVGECVVVLKLARSRIVTRRRIHTYVAI
ncbi:unnamed protein product, partial [Tenebrio molitor]